MVDMWLLFSLSIPFSEVILHTKMEQLKQKLKKLDDIKNAWTKEKDQLSARKKKIENNLRCLFFYLDVIRVKLLLCKKNIGWVGSPNARNGLCRLGLTLLK